MKTKLLLIVTFVLLAAPLRAQNFPTPSGYVNDFAGVLDQQSRDDLAAKTKALKDNKNIELGIAIITTTGDREIAEYGTALARAWRVGAKDGERRGLLLIVATQDHKSNIQVSRHLEGDFTDARCGQILRLSSADFKAGNFGLGVAKIADALIAQANSVGIEDKSATTSVSLNTGVGWGVYGLLGILGIVGFIIYRRRRMTPEARAKAAKLAELLRRPPAPRTTPTPTNEAAPYGESYPSTYNSTPDSYSSSPSASDSSSSSDSGSNFSGGGDFGGGGASDSW